MANQDTKTPLLPVLPQEMARQAAQEIRKATLPSKAPYGASGLSVSGDIGAMRQAESQKVTRRKLGGRSISNPLSYRTPETAIDAKFGPGDKVC